MAVANPTPNASDVDVALSIIQLIALLLPVIAILVQATVTIMISGQREISTESKILAGVSFFLVTVLLILAAQDALTVVRSSDVHPSIRSTIGQVKRALFVVYILVFVIVLELFGGMEWVKEKVELATEHARTLKQHCSDKRNGD